MEPTKVDSCIYAHTDLMTIFKRFRAKDKVSSNFPLCTLDVFSLLCSVVLCRHCASLVSHRTPFFKWAAEPVPAAALH